MKKRYVAIILAAGVSKRFGSPKLLYKIDGISVIEKTLTSFLSLNEIDRIFVVLGHRRESMESLLKAYPVTLIYNPYYMLGMSSSIKAGLSYIEDEDEVFIHLADKPFIKPETVRGLIEASSKKYPHIVVPVFNGNPGHPVLVGPGMYLKGISNIEGDTGLKWAIEREKKNVIYICADESVVIDIDTVDDIESIKKMGVKVEES